MSVNGQRPTIGWLDRLRGYGESVLRESSSIIAPRRWIRGNQRSDETLLDEEFLRRLERLSMVARRSVKSGLIGEHRSKRKASSFEFADFRRYVPGDDFRRIDWNAYGRLEQLIVKLTEATEEVAVHLLLDNSLSMQWGEPKKLHYGKQVLAALGYIALSRYDTVVAASFSDHIHDYFPPTRSKTMALSLFNFLGGIDASGQTDLSRAVTGYCSRQRHRGVAIVVSDLLAADGVEQGLEMLVQQGLEVTVIHLLDVQELKPDFTGDVELFDVETSERIELTIGPESLRSYQLRINEWFEKTESFCLRRGINYLRMDTSWSFEGMVIQYLRQRRLVR